MTEAATKQPGKIQQLFGLWEKAGDGELLPRAFAIELAVADGRVERLRTAANMRSTTGSASIV